MESRKEILGILLVLVIGICFALANTLAGLAYTGGTDALSVSTARFFLPALVLLIILIAKGRKLVLPRRDGLIAIALGLVTVVYTWALLSAIEILPVPLVVLVFYLFPVFTTFIVAAMGWERMSRINMVAAIVAFAGLGLALGVSSQSINPLGVIFAGIGALGLATVSAVSHRVIRSGDPRQATFYMAATAAVTFVIITLSSGEFRLPTTEPGWWGFIGTNLFYAAAMIGFFAAISLIGPAKTTLYSYVEPLVAIGAAFVLLDQVLEPLQILGGLVVVGALVVAGRANLKASKPEATPRAPGNDGPANP
ncbi:MAG: EamA family transporter [Alphaproteobacteria bacterium]|jgi:drug/metabolite transporter (DMT)-like permease|nr:EamA family transporter [Alphaproteobacteria bacterium]